LPLVRSCLRADPRRRKPSGRLLAELRRGPEPEPEPVEPVRPRSTPRKWLSLAPVGAAVIALTAIFGLPKKPAISPALSAVVPTAVAASPARMPARPASNPLDEAAPPKRSPEPVAAVPSPKPPVVPAERKPEPVPAPPAANAPPAPPALVDAQPGQVVRQVLPEITDQARRSIRGKVIIQVLATVDAGGRVTGAEIQSQTSRYFANLAAKAAEQWAFEPREGAWLLRFDFTSKSSDVRVSRAR
jgi:periplasmic protein TonB